MSGSHDAAGDIQRTVEALWRIEAPRLIATLTRTVGDLALAEEVTQDAFVAALAQWPNDGVPERPGAWLLGTARHKAVDLVRRERGRDDRYARLAAGLAATGGRRLTSGPPTPERASAHGAVLVGAVAAPDGIVEDPFGDDLMALVFLACHPVLPREGRVALTLRVVAGLTTEEIARAFLVPSATVGQRISRAKRTLAEAQVPFEVPQRDELAPRLAAVLEVVYLVFSEGYAASTGPQWVRRRLADDAIRLGRVLSALLPTEPEVHGLLALMELQASRFAARTDEDGNPVLLEDQDRSRWDRLLVSHGLAALERATRLRKPLGPYTLQAAIAARHAKARSWAETDWDSILALYDALASIAPSPVVSLNRSVAVLMADGPDAALAALDDIASDPRMQRYHLYFAVRADVLRRLDRHTEAAAVLEEGAELAPTPRERDLLLARAAAARATADGH